MEVYKNRTLVTQNMLYQNYGLDQPRRTLDTGSERSTMKDRRSLSPFSKTEETPRLTEQYLSRLAGYDQPDFSYLQSNLIAYKNQMIDDVRSEVDGKGVLSSKYSESMDTTSNVESFTEKGKMLNEIKELDELFDADNRNGQVDKNQEEQSRLFYSKCLALKMKLSSKDLAQHIPVVLLYKSAVERGVPKDKWETFIKESFARPQDYIDITKIKNKRRGGLQNKLTEIAKQKQRTKFQITNDFEIIKE